jgi:gamma-glutamyltranspeptidase/glutathione hydrolase
MRESSRIMRPFGLALIVSVILLFAGPALAEHWQETPGVPEVGGKAFRQGVVAVSHPLAAQAGAAALERGGNAIDAAAAIQFALNVVEPQFSGIGGGGFMMIHLAKMNKTFALDCREKAPGAATPTMFGTLNFTQASTSGISVGVPGTLKCVATAVHSWGERSLSDALQPAIKLAEGGFAVNKFLAADSAGFRTTLQPETKAMFRRPDGTPLQAGDFLVQPDLAKTFRLIAKQGPDVFYHGEIGQAIVEAQKRTTAGDAGIGLMTADDLASYNVKVREPIIGDYRGYTLASMSPPSSGGLTMIQMLKMLERFPLGDTSQGFGFGATNTMHVMIEAMRLAFADRAVWMGDEDFVPVPKVGLLADPYVDLRSDMIKLTSRMATPSAGDPWPFNKIKKHPWQFMLDADPHGYHDHGGYTTHFSVVDKHGNIVAYTTTIEQGWGSGIMVPGYGFLLNNELTDFNMVPTFNAATGNPGANDVAAFKRPRSSIVPTIVLKHGTPFAAYGSPGGATIINSVLNITLNLIDHDMTIQQAIDAPRLSVTSASGGVSCEGPTASQPFITPAFPQASLDALKTLGHLMPSTCSTTIGSVQAVIIDLRTGKQYGGADARREGTVIGVTRPEHWWHW